VKLEQTYATISYKNIDGVTELKKVRTKDLFPIEEAGP
jgi:hypothetical protein